MCPGLKAGCVGAGKCEKADGPEGGSWMSYQETVAAVFCG